MTNYFENPEFDEDEKRNFALQIVNGLREAINLTRNYNDKATYEQTLDILNEVNSSFYKPITELLKKKNESDTVKLYRELSDNLTTQQNPVTPTELLKIELTKMEEIAAKKKGEDKKFIKKKIYDLKAAISHFAERRVSEHKILNQDFYLVNREGYFGKEVYANDSYKDYRIDNNHILRLRLLHPDNEENILGTDLIYEQFDLKTNMVRFVHLQYKAWNDDGALYFSDDRMMKQIGKLESNLCHSKYCEGDSGIPYRLPFCSGFLRPTNRMYNSDSKIVSSGLHVPICFIQKLKSTEKKLTKSNCSNTSISSKIFEEMFKSNMLGSRWITIDNLEKFYEDKGINSLTDTIRIHAQSIEIQSEEEKHKNDDVF